VEPVISASHLGIEFYRNRKRNISLREIFLKGSSTATKETFWAVQDVSFDVMPGEAVGLVGANGHGKSTLLKLIAGVLMPDEGEVQVHGGVAPMIELTGGFENDLTARENIYLTGGLHGLSVEEIDEKFESIIDFSELHDFIDTPFRHFSSGMKVRLGFAVVTSLDEPIVLVDEVLAVGDRRFKEKCYGRMEELLAAGRTLFMVSHSEADLERFCTRGLYMLHGKLAVDSTLAESLDAYNSYLDNLGVNGQG
jgi:ABC-2 type transport system ATP-binding protein